MTYFIVFFEIVVAEQPKIETKDEKIGKINEKLDTEEKVTKITDINEKTKEKLDKNEKIKEKKVRKISFGNLISNNKKAEALEKVRKISLNLEKISSIDEECLVKDLAKKTSRREFEKELRFDSDVLKFLRRPQLDNIRQTEIVKEEKMSRSDTNIDNGTLNEILTSQNEVHDNSENQLINESYEAKRRSLKEFAKQIRQNDQEFKKIFSLSSQDTKEEPKDEENEVGFLKIFH